MDLSLVPLVHNLIDCSIWWVLQQQSQGGADLQQPQMPDADSQRQLLAQLGSRGLVKPGPRYEGFGGSIPGQEAVSATALPNTVSSQQQQEQQRLIAELVGQ